MHAVCCLFFHAFAAWKFASGTLLSIWLRPFLILFCSVESLSNNSFLFWSLDDIAKKVFDSFAGDFNGHLLHGNLLFEQTEHGAKIDSFSTNSL